MPKVILLSQVALPNDNVGSWPTLYANYLIGENQIDFIICPFTKLQFESVAYSCISTSFLNRVKEKITNKRFQAYCTKLQSLINPNQKYIIQIVDNFKLVEAVKNFLDRVNMTDQCYIQFFYHGYAPYLSNEKSGVFFESIQEMILLTKASYLEHLNYYNTLPCKFSVLHNGIDTSVFFKVSESEKDDLKRERNCYEKTVFIWCSQDRPKKGLDFILSVWKEIYKRHKNIALLVIGAKRSPEFDGVRFVGRIPNSEIASYYQMADVYLFPSLWKEGFGLTLIEALHSGCYCIASEIGGIPEVLADGKYGVLIENPHFPDGWSRAIEDYLLNKPTAPDIDAALYSKEQWNDGMEKIITNAKLSLQ